MSRLLSIVLAALVALSVSGVFWVVSRQSPRVAEPSESAATATGPVEVAIADASIGPVTVDLVTRKVTVPKPHLKVRIRLTATDPNRVIDYRVPAANDSRPVVTDEFGNSYRWSTADLSAASRLRSIRPDEPIEDLYLFPAPVPSARTLTLRIPGQCFGKSPDVVATFPAPTISPSK